MEMNVDRLDMASLAPRGIANNQQASEDLSKKIRKPYTISKSRESWTDQEHEKFLEALQLFDRDWKKIESFVGTKTVIQIRSHAQKYFLKVQKNGTGEHVPPPRPKRKSAQPYPQKASKNGDNASEPGSVSILDGRNQSTNCCSSGYSSGGWSHDTLLVGTGSHRSPPPRGTPDFAVVYQFIGMVFDPGASCHLKVLSEMTPIDRDTVLLLMRNLIINIASPIFQECKLLLADSNSNSTTHNATQTNGTDKLISTSCALSEPAANGLTSFPGKQGLEKLDPNIDNILSHFDSGHIPVIHPRSFQAQLESLTQRQFSAESGSIADIMSLPPLLLENSSLPQLVDSTPWNS
ncbi:hypothetical protein O6H91_07G020700 [Diphasiastrum complanatum]|uniref:Uncharacterized protein n=1 Tax=Diphasiastrum complanatum TaxID=34168 RepID=A0ACC2D2Z2_DIPCM|nr:hypothetical protein O6H91_07G020700 [Diphasiastrum complanatum]